MNFSSIELAVIRGSLVRLLTLVLMLCLLLPLTPARADETNTATAPFLFHVGMAKICFSNVNREDAIAAHKVLLESTGSRFGKSLKADTQVFDDTPTFEAAIQHQPMQLAIMDAWQFITMDIHQKMKPYYFAMANGKAARRFLVLARTDSGIAKLADLRGKNLLVLDVASANEAKVWLDTLLLSQKLGTQQEFFGSLEVVTKSTAAVLPVFFGKAPACIVDEPSFNLMKELNPQVGQSLRAVEISDSFANPVLCVSEAGWRSEEEKADAIQALNELHLNLVGQQTCTLFRIDRLVPFQDSDLDSIRKLQAAYQQLVASERNHSPVQAGAAKTQLESKELLSIPRSSL